MPPPGRGAPGCWTGAQQPLPVPPTVTCLHGDTVGSEWLFLCQGHTAKVSWSWESSPGRPTPESTQVSSGGIQSQALCSRGGKSQMESS